MSGFVTGRPATRRVTPKATTHASGRQDAITLVWWLAALAALGLAGLVAPFAPAVLIVVPLMIYAVLIAWAHHVTQEEGRVLRGARLAVTAIVVADSRHDPSLPADCRDWLVDLTIAPGPDGAEGAWVPQHLRLVPLTRSSLVATLARFLHWSPRQRVLRGMDARINDAWVDIGHGLQQGCEGGQRLRLHLRSKPGRRRQLVYESEVLGEISLPGPTG
jgi:hypothetical protein